AQVRYDPSRVHSFECFDSEGRRLPSQIVSEYPVRLRGKCQMVQANLSSGYWTKTPEGLKNLPREEVKNPIESWYSVETVRRIEGRILAKTPLTDGLEITLLEDPSSLRTGQKFTVAVYYGGKALRDVPVYHNGRVVGTTGDDGRINLRVREKGMQLIGVSVREKDQKGRADYTLRTFYLLFEVGR
ncbi:MAG: DUF4198 domain-containing protein, partial [Aquificota bacterium]